MNIYRVFTIDGLNISNGAVVQAHKTVSGQEIPAIIVGEEGRGRKLGVLPVRNAKVGDWVEYASVHETRTGAKYLKTYSNPNPESVYFNYAIFVLRTKHGHRGQNYHRGMPLGFTCDYCKEFTPCIPPVPKTCPNCGKGLFDHLPRYEFKFKPRPGEVLAEGRIAQGIAGRMGWGEQLVLLMPKNEILYVNMTGKTYGRPKRFFYAFYKGEAHVAAREELDILDEYHPIMVLTVV